MTAIQSNQRVAIAGAGLLGRLLAWRLCRAGIQVTLFDPSNSSGEQSAGYIAAAMLAPFSELLNAEACVFEQGLAGIEVWRQWLSELEADTGIGVAMQQRGSLVVAHQQDASELPRFNQRLLSQSCVPKEQVLSLTSKAEIAELEPELASKFNRATYLPQEGCLSNRDFYRATAKAFEVFSVAWLRQKVLELGPGCITTSQGEQRFDWVLDCRGFGAKAQLHNFRGVRGEVLWLHAPEVGLTRPVRLMHPRYQLYIAPKPNRQYVIGATEIESESLAEVTVRSSLELLSALYSVHSGFAEAQVLEAKANLRPAFMDNLPQIQIQRQDQQGLMSINGLYRHGYLLSPAVVNTALSQLGLVPTGDGPVWAEIVHAH